MGYVFVCVWVCGMCECDCVLCVCIYGVCECKYVFVMCVWCVVYMCV